MKREIILEQGIVIFGQEEISFAVKRSSRRRKTVALTVYPLGGVVVTAPVRTPLEELQAIVVKKAPWILKKRRYFAELEPTPTPKEFVSGESLFYLGRQYRLKVCPASEIRAAKATLKGGWFEVNLDESIPKPERAVIIRAALVRWYRSHAEARLPERVDLYARRLGIATPRVYIRDQQKRWGSCNAKGIIYFNWRIIMAPMSLIDYVVVHELCHLKQANHSPAYWKWVETILPDFQVRRERLRREGTFFFF